MPDQPSEKRAEFLLHMYDQMFNDIDTHILVVWQSVATLIAGFAVLALTEKNVISIDLAIALLVLVCVWQIAHLYDAGYWYNRNLAIIANIEKLFLTSADLRDVHYYFGSHRPENPMIAHLRIQYFLGMGIATLVVAYHFLTRVWPGFGESMNSFEPTRTLPYVVGIVGICYLWRLRNQRNKSYTEFLKNSPGVQVDTKGIEYGVGHGHREN
jgi:hypothetical protein